MLALVAPSRLLHFSAVKKTIQLPSQNLVAPYVRANDTLIIKIIFLPLVVECASQARDRSCYPPGSVIIDIQTCSRHNGRYRKRIVCRARKHTILKTLVGPIAEGDKKKKEDQPKPEKPKPEKPKPDRKGDKGSRRVKRPKI